jgi:DNA-binding PadR family transcriptional regulator
VKLIRERILQELEKERIKGVTIYDFSATGYTKEGKLRKPIAAPSAAYKILEDFRKKGLAKRDDEEGDRGSKPYYITQSGSEVLEVAKMVSDLEQIGESITIGRLAEKFGGERVNRTIEACLLRYKIPSEMYSEAVRSLSQIEFLQVVPSPVLRKQTIVFRE